MYYKIYEQSKNYYHVKHYRNAYDYKGNRIKIPKWKFLSWATNKIDLTDYSDIEQIQVSKCNQDTYKLTDKQKIIMDTVAKEVQDKGYIIEKDITIDNISKALTSRTVRNEDILKQYNLKRVRATKKLKERYGITSKGYPFIIVGCSYV